MTKKETIKILFFGDMVGRPGRFAVRDFLASHNDYDFVIGNVENASHGFGLTESNYNQILEYGVNCLTSGNHIWDKKDIFTYIDKADCLIRPFNYPVGTKGQGSRIFEVNGHKIAVVNALGQVFMNIVDSPWQVVVEEIKRLKEITPIVIVDFHAEATAEKICFSKVCAELGISAFFGTHTHVQTADEKVIKYQRDSSDRNCPQNDTNYMAYITDAGFCGDADGVIGMDFGTSLARFTTSIPERYDVAKDGAVQVNAVEVEIDTLTGAALSIKRIFCIIDNEGSDCG